MAKSEWPLSAVLRLGLVLLLWVLAFALVAIGWHVVVEVRRDPKHFQLRSLVRASARSSAADRNWISPEIGPLSIQDVNGDGYDDCIFWLSEHSAAVGLRVIDGRSGRAGYGASTFGAKLAVISGTKLVYATEADPSRADPDPIAPWSPPPPQLVLADLRAGRVIASEAVPAGVSALFEVADGFVAMADGIVPLGSANYYYVDLKQDKIFPTGASSNTKARLVGTNQPTPADPFVEQSLRRLRWDNETVESGVERAQHQGQYWVVPRDRSYAHLAVLDQADLAHSWELDLADGVITQLAVGRDLIGVVVHGVAADDQLLLVDLRKRRIAFRYQRN